MRYQRSRLAGNEAAPSKSRATDSNQSTALTRFYGLDRHEPLTAEDRDDLAVIAAAAERGYRIAVRCRICGAWLTNPRSVKVFVGPKCAAKAVTP